MRTHNGIYDIVYTEKGIEIQAIPLGLGDWLILVLWIGLHALLGFYLWRSWRRDSDHHGGSQMNQDSKQKRSST